MAKLPPLRQLPPLLPPRRPSISGQVEESLTGGKPGDVRNGEKEEEMGRGSAGGSAAASMPHRSHRRKQRNMNGASIADESRDSPVSNGGSIPSDQSRSDRARQRRRRRQEKNGVRNGKSPTPSGETNKGFIRDEHGRSGDTKGGGTAEASVHDTADVSSEQLQHAPEEKPEEHEEQALKKRSPFQNLSFSFRKRGRNKSEKADESVEMAGKQPSSEHQEARSQKQKISRRPARTKTTSIEEPSRSQSLHPASAIIDLTGLDDDVQSIDTNTDLTVQPSGVTTTNSAPNNMVYLEHKDKFQALDRSRLSESRARQQQVVMPGGGAGVAGLTQARAVQRAVRRVSTWLLGLLAGVSLIHTVLIFVIGPPRYSSQNFIDHYHPMVLPLHAVQYGLLCLALVSMLDRFDAAEVSAMYLPRLLFTTSGIALPVYMIAFILHLIQQSTVDKMHLAPLYNYTGTALPLPLTTTTSPLAPLAPLAPLTPADRNLLTIRNGTALWNAEQMSSEVEMWQAVQCGLSVCAVLGWLVVSASGPLDDDSLLTHLDGLVERYDAQRKGRPAAT